MVMQANGKQRNGRTVKHPQDWDKVVSAAYLRLTGASQEVVASAVDCDRATVSIWEGSEFWPTAIQEATDRWLQGLRSKAMCGVEAGVLKDGRLALDVLERMMPQLAPPTQRHEVSSILTVLAQLPMSELQRLEQLDDEELSSEVNRLAGSAP